MSDANDRCYEGVDNLEAMVEARNYNSFLADLVVADARNLGRVADFGAGTGLLGGMISDAGIKVVCVEPDPSLRELLQTHSLIAYSSLDALTSESIRYVYSFKLLEHIEDDLAACRALHNRLSRGVRSGLCSSLSGSLYRHGPQGRSRTPLHSCLIGRTSWPGRFCR